MITSEKLKEELKQFYGTEMYHKLTLSDLLATDGVAFFVDKAEAFWLLTEVASVLPSNQLKNESLIVVRAISKDNKGKIIYEDGNYNKLLTQHYYYTDLPEGEWKFYISNYPTQKVIMLPSEY